MIEYPVRLTFELQIVDARNAVVIPELAWRNDGPHIEQQRRVGNLVVDLLNANHEAGLSIGDPVFGRSVEEMADASTATGLRGLSADRARKVSKVGGRRK